jgi:DNA-binding CsgD family transcriptional regulator
MRARSLHQSLWQSIHTHFLLKLRGRDCEQVNFVVQTRRIFAKICLPTNQIGVFFAFNLNEISATFYEMMLTETDIRRCSVDHAAVYGQIPVTFRGMSPLTTRQRQIFDLVVIGQSNKEIARTLGLSVGTVKIHLAKVFEKLGVRHRSAVALAGGKLGLSLVPLPRLAA